MSYALWASTALEFLEWIADDMKRAMRSSLAWIVKLALTTTIIAAIAWKLDVKTILGTFSFASPSAIGAALLLAFIQALLSAKRLALVVSIFGRVMPFGDALRVTLEGAFFSQTFVSFIGGDAQRIWRIRKCGFSSSDSVSVIAFDRFIGIMINHLLVLIFLPYLFFAITTNSIRIGLIVIASGGFCGHYDCTMRGSHARSTRSILSGLDAV